MGNHQGNASGSSAAKSERFDHSVSPEATPVVEDGKEKEAGMSKEQALDACKVEHSELLLCFHERASLFSLSCTEERKAFWDCYESARGNARLKFGLDKLNLNPNARRGGVKQE